MESSKVGIIGSGQVAKVLADGFMKHGHMVMVGTRNKEKVSEWDNVKNAKLKVGSFSQTAAFGEIVVLAVKGAVASDAIKLAEPSNLSGKIIIDVTNPISEEPPVNGVLKFFTSINESLMERLQKQVPTASFVKAFSCVGNPLMVDPRMADGQPTMFICGNDDHAKQRVKEVLTQFGWDSMDMGNVEAARAIEPLCMLWCIPGFLHNSWTHAFKMLRK